MKTTTVLVALGLTMRVAGENAQQPIESYHITEARVAVVCALTVGGGFEARTTTVDGGLTPEDGSRSFSGAVRVDLATLETGIGLRDQHMRDIYLETRRGESFATARVENIRIDRTEGHGAFEAVLILHGERRPISGIVDLQRRLDGTVNVRAHFPVSLGAFQIRPPRYLGVGVQDQVEVRVALVVAPNGDERRRAAK
jgi:hypothetical protein